MAVKLEQSSGLDSALTRSGDTPQNERRRQILRPPEIFITTPETLNLMLASRAGKAVFSHLKRVILDEIHAVAGSKRGTHLMTAVERLTELSGEFQCVALSAFKEVFDVPWSHSGFCCGGNTNSDRERKQTTAAR